MSPDDRRPFRGAPFDRGRNDRPAGPGPERGDRPPSDRPGFGAPRPFVRTPTRGGDLPPPDHRVRLRDGDREIEVTGNPAFVRQVLDDLPALMARLRGEAPGRTAISMPAPPASQPVIDVAAIEDGLAAPTVEDEVKVSAPAAKASAPSGARNGARRTARAGGDGDLERQVFEVLRASTRPLAISAIRERIDSQPTGQEVRRLLERAGERISRSADRPATYSLR
ncbi:MAG: hypothetical protein ABI352_11180 [Candidatus Dormibacter sp.]